LTSSTSTMIKQNANTPDRITPPKAGKKIVEDERKVLEYRAGNSKKAAKGRRIRKEAGEI
jgi:hypothetical protein